MRKIILAIFVLPLGACGGGPAISALSPASCGLSPGIFGGLGAPLASNQWGNLPAAGRDALAPGISLTICS